LDQDLISTFDIVVTMTKKHLDSIVDDFDVTGVALMTLAKV
jgi:protein-tyrosine-phosphatase